MSSFISGSYENTFTDTAGNALLIGGSVTATPAGYVCTVDVFGTVLVVGSAADGVVLTCVTASAMTFTRTVRVSAPISELVPAGSVPVRPVPRTGAYTAVAGDAVLASGTFTVTLPAPVVGTVVRVKNTGTGAVTVASPALVDGQPTVVLAVQFQSADYLSDGSTWFQV